MAALVLLAATVGGQRLLGDSAGKPDVVDGFRASWAEGLPTDEVSWKPVTGAFATRSGAAFLAEANTSGPRSIAVAETEATNGLLSVGVGTMADGWGIVFRYVGPYNYWYLRAATEYSVFNVVRVADGMAQPWGATDLVPLRDGSVVEVELRGPEISVLVDGSVVYGTVDDHGLGATRHGILAAGGAESATWDSFAFRADEQLPVPSEPIVRRPTPTKGGQEETAPPPPT